MKSTLGGFGMILSVDLGTSKICAVAIDHENARPLAWHSVVNDSFVAGLPDDRHEQCPQRTLALCETLIAQLLADEYVVGRRVEGIGFSGQMHGVLLVDSALRPLTNLITWRDRRTSAMNLPGNITESAARLPADAPSRTGCRLAMGYGAATLTWLRRNGLLPEGSLALSIAGYVAASLTGVNAIDETHAASWGIYNLLSSCWDEECVAQLELPAAVLPVICPSAMPLGTVTRTVAERLGLTSCPPVCAPIGDMQASIIGAAGLAGDAVVVNIGTGSQIAIPAKSCIFTDTLDAWPMPFGDFLRVGACLCGGWSYAYLKQFLQQTLSQLGGGEMTDAEVYSRMNVLANSASPGANGLNVDTRFSGTRQDGGVSGAITGITTTNLTPANLSRAVLEGMVEELYLLWRDATCADAHRLVASGNAVRVNPLLRSIIQSRFALPCQISSLPEEAARGAAYATAVGLGLCTRGEMQALIAELVE